MESRHRRLSAGRRFGLGLLLVLGVLGSRPALAQSDANFGQDMLAFGLPGLTFAAYGAFSSIGNAMGIAYGERPTLAWRVNGFVSAGLNLGMGAALMAIGGFDEYGKSIRYGVGGANLVVGTAVLAVTIVASTRPPAGERPRVAGVALAPLQGILGSQSQPGATVAGAAVRLTVW